MTFQEWLPITGRNRVALGFALLSLVVFAIWNGIPVSTGFPGPRQRGFGLEFWPEAFSYRNYLDVLKSGEVLGFMALAAIISVIISSLISLLVIPFWKFLHASRILRIPIAITSLIGGLTLVLGLMTGVLSGMSMRESVVFTLMSVQMFSISAALLIFENELDWKPRRLDPRVPRGVQ